MKKVISILLVVLLAATLFVGCTGNPASSTTEPASTESTPAPAEKLTFSLITMDTIDQYWLQMKEGATAKAGELGVELTFDAPVGKTDPQAQADMVTNAISKGVSAIMLAATDAEALTPAVDAAKAANIPVVYVDAPAASANYIAKFATDNKAAGATAADELAKLCGEKGNVAIVNAQQSAASCQLREEGFKAQIAAKYPNMKIVDTVYSDGEPAKALSMATDLLNKHKDLVGFFACNEGSTVGTSQAIAQNNVKGKVFGVGFDYSDNVKAAISDGSMQATMVQNPDIMGANAVQAAFDFIKNGAITGEKDNDTGVTVITKDNLK